MKGSKSIFLMNKGKDAPYEDSVEDGGRVIIYEGHDAPKSAKYPSPKYMDQPYHLPSGKLTQNGRFYETAISFRENGGSPECITVYEKIRPGIWAYDGLFDLVDAWICDTGKRKAFKFKLRVNDTQQVEENINGYAEPTRIIPASVKQAVWKRDQGRYTKCGSSVNLHFDHIIPYSRGGTSLDERNVQLLCQKHNLEKRDSIL